MAGLVWGPLSIGRRDFSGAATAPAGPRRRSESATPPASQPPSSGPGSLVALAPRERPFSLHAIVVKKGRAPALAGKEKFYEFILDALVRRNIDALRGARVIDGSGSRAFRLGHDAALRRQHPAGAVKSVRFRNPRADLLVQLADMCAGVVARAYKPDRTRADRWRNALCPRIDDIG